MKAKSITVPLRNSILIIALCAVASGCGSSEASVTVTPQKINVTLDPVVSFENQTVLVKGTTNLPDGTQLHLSLENSDIPYRGEYTVSVNHHTFESQRFTYFKNPDGKLTPGKYQLDISTGAVLSQESDQIQHLLGENGVNLEGLLVKEEGEFGKIVDWEKEIEVK